MIEENKDHLPASNDNRSATEEKLGRTWEWDSADTTELRRKLLRFATLQLRDAQSAEDVVQDTLVKAFTRQHQFQAAAQWQTWVFAILRNTILDFLRSQKNRLQWQANSEEEQFLDIVRQQQFDDSGHWAVGNSPQSWGTPEDTIRQQEFMQAMEFCLEHLPDNTARVFLLREMMGLDVAEICEQTGISADNCYTILYRARNGLRRCLQSNWFNG